MQNVDIMSHSKAVSDIDRMLARFDRQDEQQQPKLTTQQEYWYGQANKLALSQKASMTVVNNGGSWQVWPVSKAGKNHEYVAEYVQEVVVSG